MTILSLDPQTAKAFDYASDLAKQLITLSTGILALTITFLRDVAKELRVGRHEFLAAAWLLYVVSMLFGVLSLMALTGALAPTESFAKPLTIPSDARVLGGIQIVTFLLATAGIVFYAWSAVSRIRQTPRQ